MSLGRPVRRNEGRHPAITAECIQRLSLESPLLTRRIALTAHRFGLVHCLSVTFIQRMALGPTVASGDRPDCVAGLTINSNRTSQSIHETNTVWHAMSELHGRSVTDADRSTPARFAGGTGARETFPVVANVSQRRVTSDCHDVRNVAKCLNLTCRCRNGNLYPQGFRFIHLHFDEAGSGVAVEVQEAERRSAALICAFWLKQDGFAGRSLWIWGRIPRARHFYST